MLCGAVETPGEDMLDMFHCWMGIEGAGQLLMFVISVPCNDLFRE